MKITKTNTHKVYWDVPHNPEAKGFVKNNYDKVTGRFKKRTNWLSLGIGFVCWAGIVAIIIFIALWYINQPSYPVQTTTPIQEGR